MRVRGGAAAAQELPAAGGQYFGLGRARGGRQRAGSGATQLVNGDVDREVGEEGVRVVCQCAAGARWSGRVHKSRRPQAVSISAEGARGAVGSGLAAARRGWRRAAEEAEAAREVVEVVVEEV